MRKPFWHWVSVRLWNRHTEVIARFLARGESIAWRGMAVYERRLSLIALTASQLFVVSLSGTRQVRSVRHGSRRAVAGVSQIATDPRWWKRLIGAMPGFAVRFRLGGDDCEFRFFDAKAAGEFADAIASTACGEQQGAAGLTNADAGDGINDPLRRPVSAWRQLALAALVPGLGQWSQGRLWAGILFFTALAVNIIIYMRPVIAYFMRTMDVSPRVLVAAGVTMGLVWLVAWIDAYVYQRLDARH